MSAFGSPSVDLLNTPAYTARLSTPGPLNVPRWDTTTPTPPPNPADYALTPQANAPYSAPPAGMPSVAMPSVTALAQTLIEQRRQQNFQDKANASMAKVSAASGPASWKAAPGASYKVGKGGGSGLGLSAYGVSKTGSDKQRGSAPYGLQSKFWSALSRMNADMAKAGLGHFTITDGFRSYAGQVKAKADWTAKGKGYMAATPGRSVHGIGYAADLGLSTAQYNWMKKNGGRYGIRNLPSETWHWQLDARLV